MTLCLFQCKKYNCIMVKMPLKIRGILNNLSSLVSPSDKSSSVGNSMSEEDMKYYPAARLKDKLPAEVLNRSLQANMTGHVVLTGSDFNINFHSGLIKKISTDHETILDHFHSRTYIKTDKETITYRNQSAYSFDNGDEYGLRAVFVPRNRKYGDYKTIMDYYFDRNTEEAFISVFADYPDLDSKVRILEAAPFELKLPFRDNFDFKISSGSETEIFISHEDSFHERIHGNSFSIETGNLKLVITLDYLESKDQQAIDFIEIKTKKTGTSKSLLINTGGSYFSTPASAYSGLKDRFRIKLEVHRS